MLSGPAKTVRRARKLRGDMSLPEVLVWQKLRLRPFGLKFRRQHPAGPYILDFYCAEAMLAVEIDGASHDGRVDADDCRDAYFLSLDIHTLRIAARHVLDDTDQAVDAIIGAALFRRPLHRSSSGPPPRSGEELSVRGS